MERKVDGRNFSLFSPIPKYSFLGMWGDAFFTFRRHLTLAQKLCASESQVGREGCSVYIYVTCIVHFAIDGGMNIIPGF